MINISRRDALKAATLSLPMAAATAIGAETFSRKKYLILSCDGGGIRGLMTAKIIQRLQQEVPFLDKVDLFAGTSTGGIIALGLANELTPTDLVDLYRRRGPEIFRNGFSSPAATGRLDRLVASLTGIWSGFEFDPRDLIRPKYRSEGLAKVLKDFFGETPTLADLKSGKSALVATLRLSARDKGWAPLILHNLGEEGASATNTRVEDRPTRLTSLVDAAMSTSAAPLYFAPHLNPGYGYCIDGGLFANCPASIALGLACRANQGDVGNIRILSIGTGSQINGVNIPESKPFNDAGEYGAFAWLSPVARGERVDGGERLTPSYPLISALFDASSASHNYVCDQALSANYHRVQVTLPKPIALDDASEASLEFLENAAGLIPEAAWKATTQWMKDQLA